MQREIRAVKVKGIKKIDNEDVYNMEVKDHHNFSVNGGLIVHNCMDRNRYACYTDSLLFKNRVNYSGRGTR